MTNNQLTVYLKLTNRCQLSCKHCYNTISKLDGDMSIETIEKVKLFLFNLRIKNLDSPIDVTFHGGEPILAGLDLIDNIITELSNLNINWRITTNLCYPITDQHIKLFLKLSNKMISTSWDYKIRFNTIKLENLWKNNVKILHDNGISVLPIICLSNILLDNMTPKDIFCLMGSIDVKEFNFERITNTGRAKENSLKPKNKKLNIWLLDAYKLYKSSNKYFIPLFNNLEKSLSKDFVGCRARKCMQNVITINPNGSLAGCPNTSTDIYGSIGNTDKNKKNILVSLEKNQQIECLKCKYFKYCNGDCFQLTKDETGCQGLPLIYEYLLNNIE